jgi:hypothetical protein
MLPECVILIEESGPSTTSTTSTTSTWYLRNKKTKLQGIRKATSGSPRCEHPRERTLLTLSEDYPFAW